MVDLSLSMASRVKAVINGSRCTMPMVKTVSIIQDSSSRNAQVTQRGGILRLGTFRLLTRR